MAGASTDVLRRVPLFDELDQAELDSVAGAMHERTFAAGDAVVVEGAPGDGFFVVASGEVEVSTGGEHRARLAPGDWFGEVALLMGSERIATITAATDLRCYVLTPMDFRTLVEGNPTIAWKVLQSMAQRLS
jgi:CRP-like cAMP-binding protein